MHWVFLSNLYLVFRIVNSSPRILREQNAVRAKPGLPLPLALCDRRRDVGEADYGSQSARRPEGAEVGERIGAAFRRKDVTTASTLCAVDQWARRLPKGG